MIARNPVAPDVSERGSSIVEFSVLGVLGFGLLVQVIVLFGVIHRATLATSAAARELGRIVVLADTESEAMRLASAAVTQAARNHGLPPGSLRPIVEGRVVRGGKVRVRVRTEVAVVQVPLLGSALRSLSVPVEATHVVRVDRYRSFGTGS
ncbi:MAG: hypothetical protein JOZ99_07945 [Actinobacteria bacterium]|nr:hypothetical protein [Actinomycetota bacterium]